MNKFVKACMVVAAFAAFLVVPSIASAVSPELFETTTATGTGAGVNSPLKPGEFIEAENVAHANTATPTVMTTSAGNVECTTATLTGELTKNNGGIEGNITTAEFKGTPGVTPHTAHCKSPLGNITVTPNHTINPEHESGGKKVASLPWCVKAGAEDKFTVRGGKCSEATRPLTFAMHTPIGICAYQKAVVEGTYTTHPSDAILTIKDQEFTKITGSAFCPASGKLDMAFTLRTDKPEPNTQALNIT